ncbi:MAG: tRNA 2-thiouridine(34) synthase MnmA, partial [Planctomycetes bacterium]|nr:tRNA 2-thiouridine(34) synthase MnmA [Planctomycetota bacterium]
MTQSDAVPALSTEGLSEGIVVAMSGGVDSSVAAWLLREAGHRLVGLFMRNGVHVGEHESAKKSCCSVSDARDARMVAAGMGIPFQSVDLKDEFGGIIRYFLAEYSAGRTPNPCAVCNRDLKFGRLLRFARELGAAGVATGHYARLDRIDGRVHVRRGVDRSKDQSYQLFCVAEQDLAHAHLPIGGLTKPAVRALAERVGLRTAQKADSQEICFV